MMNQQSFCDMEYSMRKKVTKRESFLDQMNAAIDWDKWIALIEPYYYKGERGRRPKPIEQMLRMYLLQVWFSLSDESVEDEIYDSYAFRKFMGINFTEEQVPDSTTLLHFRHLIESNKIGERLFNALNRAFDEAGLIFHGGTIVDATIISAPSSTKNVGKERDPEMHQTKKGNQWYFGMKIHAGVDAGTGLAHTIEATPANVHDVEVAPKLIREDDDVIYGDSGYIGLQKRDAVTQDKHLSSIDYRINRRPSQSEIPDSYRGINWDRVIEHQKSSVRCKVEHIFLIVKRDFGYRKVAYRGIDKNLNRFFFLFASANILKLVRAGRNACVAIAG